MCAIHLKSAYDKLCILAIYTSPLGNFNNFLTNFDLILHKFFNLKFNCIICEDINVKYLAELQKKKKKNQLDNILQSFNLSSIVNFPNRIGPNSFSTIENFFIDNSYLNKCDIIPLTNGLSDHDAQLLTIQFAQKHNKDQCTYFKRNINQYTIADFLLKLSYETLDSVFEGNYVNITFNSFLNIFLQHYYSSFPVIKANKLSNHNSWITSGIRTSCKRKTVLYIKLRNNKNPALRKYFKDYCQILSTVIKEAKKWNMTDIF